MSPALAAAMVVAAGTALLLPDSGGRLRRVLPAPAPGSAASLRPEALWQAVLSMGRRPRLAAPLAAVLAAALAGPMAAGVAAVAAVLLARALSASRETKAKIAARAAAGRSIAGLAAELRAGRSPTEALDAVAAAAPQEVAGPLLAAARAAQLGADPAAALAEHAGQVPAMEELAACWRVANHTGAGLAEVADALAADLRLAQRRQGELAVEVAASRASAKLLAGLPLVGVALGASLGAKPVHFLLHTPIGAAVLAAGLAFEIAGLLWTDRLIRGVEQPP